MKNIKNTLAQLDDDLLAELLNCWMPPSSRLTIRAL